MVSIKELNTVEDVGVVEERWNRLLSKANNQIPYFSFHWYNTALKTIDKDKQPLLLFVESSGEDTALIPLVCKADHFFGFKYYTLSFIQNPYCPYQGFVYVGDFKNVLHALLKYLRKRFGQFFYMDLDEVRLSAEEASAFEELADRGMLSYRDEKKAGSRYLILGESFEQTVGSLKKKTQKEFRRKIKRLSGMGRLDLRRIQGDHDIEEHLDRFFRFYARTWKGEEPYPEFYYELFENFDRMGTLRFYGLTLNGEPIAYLACILAGDTMYGIKTTYDPSYYAYSPGVILFYKCIEDMFSISGIREFDIGRGDEQFKREWTSVFHDHRRMFVYPKTAFWDVTNKIRYEALPAWKENRAFAKAYSFIRSQLADHTEECDNDKEVQKVQLIQSRVRWDEIKDRTDPEGLVASHAKPEDLSNLVVAMASPNIKEVQERLEKEVCVLIMQGERLMAYFWISSEDGEGAKAGSFSELKVDQWGVRSLPSNSDFSEDCIYMLFKFKRGKGKNINMTEFSQKDVF